MATAIIPAKIPISRGLSTFLRIIISGKLKAVTAIMNASTVPTLMPFSISAKTIGIIPAALE